MVGLLIRKTTALIALSLTLTGCGWLDIYFPNQRSPGNQPPPAQPEVSVGIIIGSKEARAMAVANGLTGFRGLPPGIQRNLARGKPLPPGIAKRFVPERMLAGLPRYPDREWRIAGRDLVLIAIGTLVVLEILEDVFA